VKEDGETDGREDEGADEELRHADETKAGHQRFDEANGNGDGKRTAEEDGKRFAQGATAHREDETHEERRE
jgi:hypothetical protein